MTCRKNCIHYEACKDIYYPMSTYDEEAKAFDESNSCDGCPFYSDASRFIELPCKVGDTVYYLLELPNNMRILPAEVWGISIQKTKNIYEIYLQIKVNVNDKFRFDICPKLGNTVFLTREEAEKALKERE